MPDHHFDHVPIACPLENPSQSPHGQGDHQELSHLCTSLHLQCLLQSNIWQNDEKNHQAVHVMRKQDDQLKPNKTKKVYSNTRKQIILSSRNSTHKLLIEDQRIKKVSSKKNKSHLWPTSDTQIQPATIKEYQAEIQYISRIRLEQTTKKRIGPYNTKQNPQGVFVFLSRPMIIFLISPTRENSS